MMRTVGLLLVGSLVLTQTLMGQNPGRTEGETHDEGAAVTPPVVASANAVKAAVVAAIPGGSLNIDGRLDEEVWSLAQPITDFIQKEPDEGVAPSEQTEVRFVYDEDALYIGARMYSSGGRAEIQAPLGRRDSGDQAESIRISLDTFLDRRTAYTFGVTAAGVRLDEYHPTDNENNTDSGFNPVWQARVSINDDGWTAEMWIPFAQLRFSNLSQQLWGVNVHRFIPSKNEDDYWVLVPRTEQGWASRFGQLSGIQSVRATRRVEILPYVTGGSTLNSDRDDSDPFDDGRNLEGSLGVDLKMGLGPNLTLDGTIRPDFGQVEADPAEVNLSVQETNLQERRPFFTEGSRLIGGSVNNYFYSRRIGAAPGGGRASGDFVDYPKSTEILGAAKVTGRLPSGTSIGILTAFTQQEQARTFDLNQGIFENVRVQPRAGWGVARVQQEVGRSGSTVAFLVAGVKRDLSENDVLAPLMARSSLTLEGESFWRLGGGTYELSVSGGMTRVAGHPDAILAIQRSSAHYFQRPDASHVDYDPTRTTIGGMKATAQLEKVSGDHWLWNVNFDTESPEVEFNEIGRLGAADGLGFGQSLTYRETRPKWIFRNYRFTASNSVEWTYGGELAQERLSGSSRITWNNFWTTNLTVNSDLRIQDWRLTRGGPLMEKPWGWSTSLQIQNPTSSRTRLNTTMRTGRDEEGGWNASINGTVSLVPAPSWQISLGPRYEREVNSRQYVQSRANGSEATFGRRYIFAFIDRSTLSMEARVNFTLKPDVSLEFYAEPFAASGRYYDFGELSAAGARSLRTYGTDGTTIEPQSNGGQQVTDGTDSFVISNRDFIVRSFRSTSVVRWEWRPGSTLYLVWQQDRSEQDPIGQHATVGDMFSSLGATGSNFFAIKASYWLGR